MADDMNGNEAHRTYTDAVTAQLGERVTNLGRRQTDLEAEMRTGFKQMESALGALGAEMRNSTAALSTNMAERNKPQWQALGVALTFATVLGGLAYMPIRESTSDLKASVAIISERMVTQQETEWRMARGQEDRARSETAISDIRSSQVPRPELDRVFMGYDQRFGDVQRQVDELKQAQGGIYGARDIIMDLNENQQRIEREL